MPKPRLNASASASPTLFLDFDGVLHPGHCSPGDFLCHLPRLLEALGQANVDTRASGQHARRAARQT